MKINPEDYLHQIDAYFAQKSQKDIYMIYIMAFSVVFSFSYLLFWDASLAGFQTKRDEITSLQSKLELDKLYLQYNPEAKISTIDRDILLAQKDMNITKGNNLYIKEKIETISFLIYDERTWGEYINSIANHANRYGIKILNFSNNLTKTGDSFGHVLDIEVKSTGDYVKTLKFMNELEKSDLVVDMHDINISARDALIADMNISVWGITY